MGKSLWDIIAPLAGAALGSVVPGIGTAIGASIGTGLETGVKTGNPLAGILAGGGSYLGGQLLGGIAAPAANSIGGSIAGQAGASTLNAANSGLFSGTVGSTLGSTASNVLGSGIANTSISGLAGGALGSSLGESLGQSINPPSAPDLSISGESPFHASRDAAMGLPQSLSQFGSGDPTQQSTGIATQGVYGGGEGPDEQKYFLNLINRRLVNDQGQVAGDTSSINPVEGSYLNQLGLGGYSDPTDLLKKIHGYAAV